MSCSSFAATQFQDRFPTDKVIVLILFRMALSPQKKASTPTIFPLELVQTYKLAPKAL